MIIIDKKRERMSVRSKRIKVFFVGHIRKLLLLALNFLFNRAFVYRIIGRLNRRYRFLRSVFVAYPSSEEYALAYVYRRHRHIMRWRPWPAGIFRQNDRWGLMTVISSTENDFRNEVNNDNLREMTAKTDEIRRMLGAEQKTFAGILPGILHERGIIKQAVEAEVTVDAILQAERGLREHLKYEPDTPLVVLGGRGFIGRRLVKKMANRNIYKIDKMPDTSTGNQQDDEWPVYLQGKKAILVNITKKAALSEYLDRFWPQLALLNETYPEPSERELDILTGIGCPAFHIVGIAAKAYPSFPRAYEGGIPCCASWKDPQMEVIIRKLN